MNISIKDFALKIGVEKDKVIEIVKALGIKKTILNDEAQQQILKKINKGEENMQDEKELKLKQFHKKIIKERDKLKKEQEDFEVYKKSEKQKLQDRLTQQEIQYNENLDELRIKKLKELTDNFQEKLSNEYEIIKDKLIEISRKEAKLKDNEAEFYKFEKDKELFESQKEKILSEYHQELEKNKEIFYNKSEEERVKKLEDTNKIIEKLYEDKTKELEKQEEVIREKDAKLKTQIAEVMAKEKALELQEDSLYKQAQEKIKLEVKNYQEKVKSFENQNQSLIEELLDLREDLNDYEKFENRDLPRELDQKQQDNIRLKKLLDEETEIKNKLQVDIDKISNEYLEEKAQLSRQIDILRRNIKETDALKSQNALLTDKTSSLNHYIEFLKGENKDLNDRLKSIYSDGTEIEERIKDIKEKPYEEIQLDTPISITDEIKYLDSIQKGMKDYGVEYPKRLLYAFHTALKSAEFSPLSVLSGVSGTGKSELPKLYSHFGGFNFLAEAVQPTWDSPASMIGYYNTIDRKFDSTNILKFLLQTSQSKSESPYGLKESMNMILLDEMNLAHIELYFAEFLSKFEQRRGSRDGDVHIDIQLGTALVHKLPLDKNMLWIGTMNEDETTKSLSDKVLDRAFSINFPRPDALKSRPKLKTLDEIKKFQYLHRNTWNQWIQKKSLFSGEKSKIIEDYRKIANEINKHLEPTGRAIGHRVWQSMEYYISNHPEVIQNLDNEDELIKYVKLSFEEQLVQKIMPKLRGIELHGKEKDSLMNIKEILNQNDFKITEDFELSMDNPYGQFIWNSANYLKED